MSGNWLYFQCRHSTYVRKKRHIYINSHFLNTLPIIMWISSSSYHINPYFLYPYLVRSYYAINMGYKNYWISDHRSVSFLLFSLHSDTITECNTGINFVTKRQDNWNEIQHNQDCLPWRSVLWCEAYYLDYFLIPPDRSRESDCSLYFTVDIAP